MDSTEPVGPAANLFTKGFYAGIAKALKEVGIFVAQTDNPRYKADLIINAVRNTREIFPVAAYIRATSRHIQVVCRPLQSVQKSMNHYKLKLHDSLRLIQSITRLNCIKRHFVNRNLLKNYVNKLVTLRWSKRTDAFLLLL